MTRKIKYGLAIAVLVAATTAAIWFTSKPAQHAGHTDAAAGAVGDTQYTCGMHPQVIQDKPGNCPICGMKLTKMKTANGTVAKGTSGERKVKYWRAPMDPTYTSDKPGKSPMGMDLVPVYEDQAAAASDTTISIDPVTTQNMGIRTAIVTKGPLRRVIRTVGNIDYDETTLADVTIKFSGWMEKLHVDATGKLVMKGDPLFDIYSPELYSAQTEYVLALDRAANSARPGNESMLRSSRLKLQFFDISEEQIAELEKTRQPVKSLRVNAPTDGFVIEKTAVQGMMTQAGMKLYRLADLGLVWVYAEVYEQDLPFIHLGQEALVSLSYLPDRQFRGRVTYIYPTVNEKTRTARVRMEFHNPGYLLKPGMFASVQLSSELAPSVVLAPDMAILRSGTKNTVFVALDGGTFDPRRVTLGARAQDDMYHILSGLEPGERIVTSGQFLLDSESQLREAIQKMRNPEKTKTASPSGEVPAEPSSSANHDNAADSSEPPLYVCPMPDHVSIEYQHPGECPLCGMSLVPVSAAALAKMQPGGKVEFYTCPMPDHSDVKTKQAGKCPKCGMTLIPVMPVAPPPSHEQSHSPLPSPLYTCPMESHADVVSDHPGKCPKCDMELVDANTVAHRMTAEKNWSARHQPAETSKDQPAHQH